MRRLLPAALLLVTLLPATAAHGQEQGQGQEQVPVDDFTFYGSGFGHGLGMSQWGAYGLAQQGWNPSNILGHYYSGTEVGAADAPPGRLRIGLAQGLGSVRLEAQAADVEIRIGSRNGNVVATIPGGQTWRVRVAGDEYRIIGEHLPGGFAEYVVVPAENVMPVPDGFDLETAAAAPLTFLTAWRALVTRGRLRAGERVLITGASGGVSTAAIQIARHLGAEVHAITTAENLDRVRALGAHYAWDRGEPGHRRQMWDATGRRGFPLILDSVGQATWHENVRALARAGRLVVYGATSGPHAVTDIRYLFWKQVDVLGSTMSNRREFEAVMDLVFRGVLRPVIDSVYPLDQVRAAQERLEAGAQFGKILLRP